jgi:hypothetical protein
MAFELGTLSLYSLRYYRVKPSFARSPLCAEEDRRNPNGKNKHVVFVKFTRKFDISHLDALLAGSISWSTKWMDIVMQGFRHTAPSTSYSDPP